MNTADLRFTNYDLRARSCFKRHVSRLLLCALGLLLVAGSGCSTLDKSGVYAGDQVLYQSELTINTGYDVIHSFVAWEKENRVMLAQWPEIKASADVMREHARDWFATANAAHDAYKLNPTDANKTALGLAMEIVRAALTEASRYMAEAASIKN